MVCGGSTAPRVSRRGAGSLRKRDLAALAERFVDGDEGAVIAGPLLLVGVQQLDAVNRAVGRNVYVELVTDVDGLVPRRLFSSPAKKRSFYAEGAFHG